MSVVPLSWQTLASEAQAGPPVTGLEDTTKLNVLWTQSNGTNRKGPETLGRHQEETLSLGGPGGRDNAGLARQPREGRLFRKEKLDRHKAKRRQRIVGRVSHWKGCKVELNKG